MRGGSGRPGRGDGEGGGGRGDAGGSSVEAWSGERRLAGTGRRVAVADQHPVPRAGGGGGGGGGVPPPVQLDMESELPIATGEPLPG